MVNDLFSPWNDPAYLVRLIAEVTGSNSAEVQRRFDDERRSLGVNVWRALQERRLPPHAWNDALAEFYSETDAFLFETCVWNGRLLKIRTRRWIGDFLQRDQRPLKILAYGDGLGFDSLHLAQRGHNVGYFEVSRKCQAFARKIFERAGASVRILTTADPPQQGGFDAVLCLDVLEHVPQPEELVGRLAGYLRPGGRLIVSAPFHYTTAAVGTHLKSNRKYCGDLKRLFGALGLVLADGHLLGPHRPGEARAGHRCPAGIETQACPLAVRGALAGGRAWWNLPHNLVTQWLVRAKS